MAYLIRVYCPSGASVLDPFCGSGSTGVAAIRENRQFTGIDLSPEYVKIAIERCADEEVAYQSTNSLEDALY